MNTERFKIKLREYYSVFSSELQQIFKDAGLVLVLVVAIILYTTIYSLAYKNQVLRNVPVGVVDLSQTSASRKLTEAFGATPNINIAYNPTSMAEAEELFYKHEIYGIMYIPADFEENIMLGRQAIVGLYVDGSYFLMYRQVFYDAVGSINDIGTEVEVKRLMAAGATALQAETISNPVVFKSQNLFNPYTGYGTFVMPPIMIVIIQQTLLIGIGMMGGTWREFGLYKKLRTPGEKRLSTLPIVLGKSTAYFLIYIATGTYIFGIHYRMFGFPMNALPSDVILFMIPYLLSCIFLGIAVSTLFRYRENSLLILLWSSIPVLLISGVSFPGEAMPAKMLAFGKILPSSSGIDGFIRLQTMGATLKEVGTQYTTLWILTGVYLLLACIGIRIAAGRDDKPSSTAESCNSR